MIEARVRFGAKPALLHLLHEAALAVARRGLGLLRLELEVAHVNDVPLGKRRQLLVALETVRVGLAESPAPPARRPKAVKGSPATSDGELGVLDGRGTP